jgi:hypothetical protein
MFEMHVLIGEEKEIDGIAVAVILCVLNGLCLGRRVIIILTCTFFWQLNCKNLCACFIFKVLFWNSFSLVQILVLILLGL